MRASSLAVWAAVGVAATIGCGSSSDAEGSPAPQCTAATAAALTAGTVTLSDNVFTPACARVAPGTTVTFTNGGALAHTVTAEGGGFDHLVNPGQQVTQSFAAAATVGIRCTLHPGMRMTLFVQ